MIRYTTLFIDNDIASLLREECTRYTCFQEISCIDNYCADSLYVFNKKIQPLIVQLSLPLAPLQDLLFDIDQSKNRPPLLAFERLSNNRIRYVISDPTITPLSLDLAAFFEHSLLNNFSCERVYCRTTIWENNEKEFIRDTKRQEVLKEILIGHADRELNVYRERYNWDLRNMGQYIFLWQSDYGGYDNHACYKDVYNLIGQYVKETCTTIINGYHGGEVFFLEVNQICMLINASPSDDIPLETLLGSLLPVLKSKRSLCYFSSKVSTTSDLRLEYKRYLKQKSLGFFFRNDYPIESALVEMPQTTPDSSEIHDKLKLIENYLLQDIHSPNLINELHKLYWELIKPSMNFAIYLHCTSTIIQVIEKIYAEIGESSTHKLNMDIISPDIFYYSSLDEQFAILLDMIAVLASEITGNRHIQNSLAQAAIKFISQNFRKIQHLEDISQALYVSSGHLSITFKEAMGMSPMQYLIFCRMKHAKKLLETTDLTISSVAAMVGYYDYRHFSKTFKEKVGESPSLYRKKNSNKIAMNRVSQFEILD